jgi:hypothetical protein
LEATRLCDGIPTRESGEFVVIAAEQGGIRELVGGCAAALASL